MYCDFRTILVSTEQQHPVVPGAMLNNCFPTTALNFQILLITPPILVNICVVQHLSSAKLLCTRCMCKQTFTHSLTLVFTPEKAVAESIAAYFNNQCPKASNGT